MEFLKGKDLEDRLQGRDALIGSIKLRLKDSDEKSVREDFLIYGVLDAGSSCICYKADRFIENGITQMGTLKEFYPREYEVVSDNANEKYRASYHLKRYGLDAGDLAKQLYSEELTSSNFEDAKGEFCNAYYQLLKLMEDNEGSDSYFQPVNIYRGISKNGDSNHTVYIWTPGDSNLKSFDDHLDAMQKRADNEIKSPQGNLDLFLAKELHMILQTVKALAKGIRTLHESNLLHLDIKPSNFGVRDLGENNGDNISISMFDVNSFHLRDSRREIKTQGTKHFSAPELSGEPSLVQRVGCVSDIYSLGATLYNSVVVKAGGRGLYDTEKFSEISAELSHSLLIEFSEYTSNAEIFDSLVRILKRSLARRDGDYADGITNYQKVSEFIDDVDKVDEKIKQLIGIGIEEGTDKKATLEVLSKEDYYSREIERFGGVVSAMQCLLYDQPLYRYAKDGKLNILLLGAGLFGQKFLDIAFELSQIKGCYLNVTVASKDKNTDEKRFLESRPEFKNYFRVNGQEPDNVKKYAEYGDSVYCDYGSVSFVELESELSMDTEKNIAVLKRTLGQEKFSYVFISLSDENLNRRIACDLSKTDSLLGEKSIINFVTYKDFAAEKQKLKASRKKKATYHLFDASYDEDYVLAMQVNNAKLNPVFVRNTLINHPDFRFLERISFNCHILWESNLSLDVGKTYESFTSPYYYSASMATAVSLKYKLHSIGLSLEAVRAEKDPGVRREKMLELTQAYRRKIGLGEKKKTKEQKDCLNELTMYEHARWLTNMICSSHRQLPKDDFEHLKGGNKDKAKRKHSCIVPSGKEWALNRPEWKTPLTNWDKPDITESDMYKKLDPLDRMSVDLHTHYMGKAKPFDMDKLESEAESVRKYISTNFELLTAFNAYIIAMRGLMSRKTRNSNAKSNYEHCAAAFAKKLEKISPSNKDAIEKAVKNLEEQFAYVREAYDYIDYKELDHRILVSLPFIFNYSIRQRICIPLVAETAQNMWFENVAACIAINPAAVTYMVHIDKLFQKNRIVSEKILSILSNITNVMESHNLQTRINLIFYTETDGQIIQESTQAEEKAEIKKISSRIEGIDFIAVKNEEDLVQKIKNTLITTQQSPLKFSAVETNKASSISGIVSAILSEVKIPAYRFDSVKMHFKKANCSDGASEYCWYNDIPFKYHLHVEDAFAAHGRLGVYSEPELHKDYEAIWNNCCNDNQKMAAWKAICRALNKKTEESNKVMDAQTNSSPFTGNGVEETVHFLPRFCRASVEKILTFLAGNKVRLVNSWEIVEHNSAMFRVKFSAGKTVCDTFKKILSKNIYVLADDTRIQTKLCKSSDKKVFAHIYVDSLVVDYFDFDDCVCKAISEKIAKKDYSDYNKQVYNKAKEIFKFLIRSGYIIEMGSERFIDTTNTQSLEGKKFKFCFASDQIKNLLTTEGQIGELYTYYKALESGFYDDVRTSLEVRSKKHDDDEYVPMHEFDIVAVKGFSTQFVEVKCCNKLENEFYYKLKANVDSFGINRKLALVSFYADKNLSSINADVIRKGEEDYSVKTITYEKGQLHTKLTEMMKDTDK